MAETTRYGGGGFGLSMPEDKWPAHRAADLWFTASEAVEHKIADEIGEFAPPVGTLLFNI